LDNVDDNDYSHRLRSLVEGKNNKNNNKTSLPPPLIYPPPAAPGSTGFSNNNTNEMPIRIPYTPACCQACRRRR
jgi:hypothetical protein